MVILYVSTRKGKEAKLHSSRQVSSKGYLQVIRMRDVRRSHKEVMGCLSSCTREQV
jgi:hypothetical protein